MKTLFDELLSDLVHYQNYKPSAPTAFQDENGELKFEVEVPGFSNADLNISVTDNQITITGEKGKRKLNKVYNINSKWNLNKADAVCTDGILYITIPKLEVKKVKNIPISAY